MLDFVLLAHLARLKLKENKPCLLNHLVLLWFCPNPHFYVLHLQNKESHKLLNTLKEISLLPREEWYSCVTV